MFRSGAVVFIVSIFAALTLGCATYRGTASSAEPATVARQGNWKMVPRFPLVRQVDDEDCGAASLAAVLRYWGQTATPESIEAALGQKDSRLQAGEMQSYAKSSGLRSYVFYGTMKDIAREIDQGRPVIVGLGKMFDGEKKALSHYEVVVGYEPTKKQVLLLDPGRGWQVDSFEGFAKEWAVSKAVTIVAYPATGGATASIDESYASREATAPEAKKYRAGDVLVISASTLAVILLVVLLIVLL
jgi:ABC-type bacteriocin/lantibiotic exporter with double-glycine peptidase domain